MECGCLEKKEAFLRSVYGTAELSEYNYTLVEGDIVTASQFDYVPTGNITPKKLAVAHKYCPFCGVKY